MMRRASDMSTRAVRPSRTSLLLVTGLIVGFIGLWLTAVRGGSLSTRCKHFPANISGDQEASLIILVTSTAGHTERRSWLRAQLYHSMQLLQKPSVVVVRFVIGNVGLSPSLLQSTTSEQQQHGDLLYLDVPDADDPDPPPGDSATSLKVAHGMVWARQHYTFRWLVRLGDDSFFRVDHFLTNVAGSLPQTQVVLGHCPPSLVYRFPNGASTRYCSGMGFVLSADVVAYIANGVDSLFMGYPEDAVVGLWMSSTKFIIRHDDRFHDWKWKRCSNESIIVHKHDYGSVGSDGIMRSCFPDKQWLPTTSDVK